MEVALVDQIVAVTLKIDRIPDVNDAATDILRQRLKAPDHVSHSVVLAMDLMPQKSGQVRLCLDRHSLGH